MSASPSFHDGIIDFLLFPNLRKPPPARKNTPGALQAHTYAQLGIWESSWGYSAVPKEEPGGLTASVGRGDPSRHSKLCEIIVKRNLHDGEKRDSWSQMLSTKRALWVSRWMAAESLGGDGRGGSCRPLWRRGADA